MNGSLWSAYVKHFRNDRDLSPAAFAKLVGGSQSKIWRWEHDATDPAKILAADVAHFAQALGRNPVEAFVAAGMLTLDEARGALNDDSLALLDQLAMSPLDRHDAAVAAEQAARRGRRADAG